jgi:hypothetical protein
MLWKRSYLHFSILALAMCLVGCASFDYLTEVTEQRFATAHDCGKCHVALYNEWAGSDHDQGQFATQTCADCHTEQDWKVFPQKRFHSETSSFPLRGGHRTLRCDQCHQSVEANAPLAEAIFTGLDSACTTCHEDPHQKQFSPRACTTCHDEQDWQGFPREAFHGETNPFPLRGGHQTVTCRDCHTPTDPNAPLAEAHFAGLGRDCTGCHQNPHEQSWSEACTSCHSEQGWTGRQLLFEHDRQTSFKLDAVHGTVTCIACHTQADQQYTVVGNQCQACHTVPSSALAGTHALTTQGPDPHQGRVTCTDCHDLSHPHQSVSDFSTRCVVCHNEAYRGLFSRWYGIVEQATDTPRQIIGFHNLRFQQSYKETPLWEE